MTLNKKLFLKFSIKFNWKILNTKYEHSVDKQEWKNMLYFVSSVKY